MQEFSGLLSGRSSRTAEMPAKAVVAAFYRGRLLVRYPRIGFSQAIRGQEGDEEDAPPILWQVARVPDVPRSVPPPALSTVFFLNFCLY